MTSARLSQSMRRMSQGTVGGQSRVATPRSPFKLPTPVIVAPPEVPTCPVYVGALPSFGGNGWELSPDGTILYAPYFSGSDTVVAAYTFPGLMWIQDITSSTDTGFSSTYRGICVAGGRLIVKWTNDDDTGPPWPYGYQIRSAPVSGGASAILHSGVGVGSSNQNGGGICRQGHDPDRYYLLHITGVTGSTQSWYVHDQDPAGGGLNLIASGTDDTGPSSSVYESPISTPDGAIWVTRDAGGGGKSDIFRWDPTSGVFSQAMGIGTDSPDPFDLIGPAGNTNHLVPRPDNSVWWHNAKLGDDAGEHEFGYRTDASLVTTIETCMETLNDSPYPASSNIMRLHAAASTPGAELAAFGPLNGDPRHVWRIGAVG